MTDSNENPTPEADWTVLEDPRVEAVLALASKRVGTDYSGVSSADDQRQEGSIILALNAELVRKYVDEPFVGERHLYRWLYSRLVDNVATDAARSNRHVPLGVLGGDAPGE